MGEVSTDPETVANNGLLALLILLLVLYSTTVFNATIKQNSENLTAGLARLMAPFAGIFAFASSALARAPHDQSFLGGLLKPLALLALVSVTYGFLDPTFGFNRHSLVLVGSLSVAFMILTYTFEGGQVLASERLNREPADLHFYPLPVLIALGSVVLSRILGINPGLILGFIGSAKFFSQDIRREGRAVFISMIAMATVALIGWLLISPLRSLSEDENVWWAASLEAGVIAIFVGGVEGILFSLVPLEFVEGKKVWIFSRLAWFGLAFPIAFVFFHVVLNFETSFGDSARTAIVVCVFAVLVTLVWLILRVRARPGASRAPA
jgi:hypothetical protein